MRRLQPRYRCEIWKVPTDNLRRNCAQSGLCVGRPFCECGRARRGSYRCAAALWPLGTSVTRWGCRTTQWMFHFNLSDCVSTQTRLLRRTSSAGEDERAIIGKKNPKKSQEIHLSFSPYILVFIPQSTHCKWLFGELNAGIDCTSRSGSEKAIKW